MSWNKRIVVAYDGSAPARAALMRATSYTRPGDHMTVIHVRPGGEASPEILDGACRTLRDRSITPEVVAAVGDPAQEVLAAAHDADLLIVAQHPGTARDGLGDALVHGAPCDVLVVHVG